MAGESPLPLRESHAEKVRFIVVGVWNTAFGYALFLAVLAVLSPLQGLSDSSSEILSAVGREYYLLAQWTAWVLAVVQSTASMKHFVFRSSGRLLPHLGRSYLVYLPTQALSSLVLWIAVRGFGLQPQIGMLVAIAVSTGFAYVGHKYFTFGTTRDAGVTPDE